MLAIGRLPFKLVTIPLFIDGWLLTLLPTNHYYHVHYELVTNGCIKSLLRMLPTGKTATK